MAVMERPMTITDEMIAAGRHAWDCNMGGDPKAVLRAIYLAMRSSAPPVMGMEEMVERGVAGFRREGAALWLERNPGEPLPGDPDEDELAALRRLVTAILEASRLLSTPLVTGRE
jgi:hypothetical protein